MLKLDGRGAGERTGSRLAPRAGIAALGAAAALLVAVPVAGALIVPQSSIRGVKLGMTRAEVTAKLGEPNEKRTRRNELIGKYVELRYGRTVFSLYRDSDGYEGTVFNMTTRSRAEKTKSGVGVGSSERAVRRGVKNARCMTEFGRRTCTVGKLRPGRKVTTFDISRKGGKVTRVSTGFVID